MGTVTLEEWKQKFDEWDLAIRGGQIGAVREKLAHLALSTVPPSLRSRLGHLFVRLHLPHRALAALMPKVRLGSEFRDDASVEDKLTYALALIRSGLTQEAGILLAAVPDSAAQKHLYLAYLHQTRWEYVDAIPRIRHFVSFQGIPEYELAVANLNLLACLVFAGELNEAENLHSRLSQEADRQGWELISRSLMELGAQLAVTRMDLGKARRLLEEANSKNIHQDGVIELWINKWLAVVALYEKASTENFENLVRVRDAAKTFKHWETIRDCDRVLAEIKHDPQFFNYVYFGTPYQSFRDKMLMACQNWAQAPKTFLLGQSQGPVLDLLTARTQTSDCGLKPGQLLHRALIILLSDFYRPISLGRLFAELFPGEYFDAESSPKKINTLIFRLRTWAAEEDVPIQISAENNSFLMSFDGQNFGILLHDISSEQKKQQELSIARSFAEIGKQLGDQPFTAQEAAQILNVSKSTATRLLNQSLAGGLLEKTGNARATVYRWVKS